MNDIVVFLFLVIFIEIGIGFWGGKKLHQKHIENCAICREEDERISTYR